MIIHFSQYRFFIDNLETIVNNSQKILGDKLFFWLMSKTLGRQFISGNDIVETEMVINRLHSKGFHLMTYYMAEYLGNTPDQQFYIDNKNQYVRGLQSVEKNKFNFFSIAIKLTALVDYDIIIEANKYQNKADGYFLNHKNIQKNDKGIYISKKDFQEILKQEMNEKEFEEFFTLLKMNNESDKLYYVEWRLQFSFFNQKNQKIQNHKFYQKVFNFNEKDIKSIKWSLDLIREIIETAMKKNPKVKIAMDAEQDYLQNAISALTEQLQFEYNKNEVIILNTFQAYLKKSHFKIDMEFQKQKLLKNYNLGIKLVRGAYKKEEDEYAEERNQESPIYKIKEETDCNYDKIASEILQKLDSNCSFIVGTHNNTSVYKIMDQIEKFDSKKQELLKRNIELATLHGLNDYLAHECLNSGYNTIKYLTYGEKEITIPFLIRRGLECKEIMQRSSVELDLIKEELKRRFKFKNNQLQMENILNCIKIIKDPIQSLKYKNVLKCLFSSINSLNLTIKKEQIKDFSEIISLILIYDYKKIKNYDMLISYLSDFTQKQFKQNLKIEFQI